MAKKISESEKQSVIESLIEPSTDHDVDIGKLAHKIESLSGKEKQRFCKTLTDSQKKAYIDYCKDRDMELVTCMFKCLEPLGGNVKFTACPYEGTEETWIFEDGKTYTVPYYVVKRFNDSYQGAGVWYPTHAYVLDAAGKPIVQTAKKNYRYMLSSTAFDKVAS